MGILSAIENLLSETKAVFTREDEALFNNPQRTGNLSSNIFDEFIELQRARARLNELLFQAVLEKVEAERLEDAAEIVKTLLAQIDVTKQHAEEVEK